MENYYSEIAKKYHLGKMASIEELDELIEVETQFEEKDSAILAEDKEDLLL